MLLRGYNLFLKLLRFLPFLMSFSLLLFFPQTFSISYTASLRAYHYILFNWENINHQMRSHPLPPQELPNYFHLVPNSILFFCSMNKLIMHLAEANPSFIQKSPLSVTYTGIWFQSLFFPNFTKLYFMCLSFHLVFLSHFTSISIYLYTYISI